MKEKSFLLKADPDQHKNLVRSDSQGSIDQRLPASLLLVWRCMQLLLKIRFPTPMPAWFPYQGPGRVSQVKFDFFMQEISFVTTKAFPFNVQLPQLRSVLDNTVQIAGDPSRNINAMYPSIRFTYWAGPGPQDACDLCSSIYKVAGSVGHNSCRATAQVMAGALAGLVACKMCMAMRRPCTWTTAQELEGNGWKNLVFLTSTVDRISIVGDALPTSGIVEVEQLEDLEEN